MSDARMIETLRAGALIAAPPGRAGVAWHPAAKRAMDVALAGLLLALLALPMLLLALLVRADGGPALFAHTRVGKAGQRFGCLKFRSMVLDAECRLNVLLEADPAARRNGRPAAS